MTKLSLVLEAVADYDFAKRAASYGGGHIASRDVLCHAVKNLPSHELKMVRDAIETACMAAVARTEAALSGLGIETDVKHPNMAMRAGGDPK